MVGGRFAKVISKVYIDRSTSLVLVRILKEYYVILIGPNKAEVIQKLDTIDEGEIEKPEDFNSQAFFYFNLFQSISIYFNLFQSISIY